MREKYCVLPGQEPVRLASTSGHTCIIGEEPREIPEQFEREAIAKGCFTETMIEGLKKRIAGDAPKDPPANAERAEKIKAAVIEIVNAGNPDDLTSGKPKVDVLSAKLGFEVTAKERDAAI